MKTALHICVLIRIGRILQKAAYLKRYRAGLVQVSGDFPWSLLERDYVSTS